MPQEYLLVRGAREHNLKDISVAIPRNQLTVITGLSGSGKSSLAFDTIYAEGQRRFIESMSKPGLKNGLQVKILMLNHRLGHRMVL